MPAPPSLILLLRSSDFAMPALPPTLGPIEFVHDGPSEQVLPTTGLTKLQDGIHPTGGKLAFDIEKELQPLILALSSVTAIRVEAKDVSERPRSGRFRS